MSKTLASGATFQSTISTQGLTIDGNPSCKVQHLDASGEAPAQDLRCLVLRLGYRGQAFAGFARQPGILTVQGNIEEALGLIFGQEILCVCAGRTDAGVHARGQVVSFEIDTCKLAGRSPYKLVRSLNALTHEDIVIYELYEAELGFSARFDAIAREYHYHIHHGSAPSLLLKDLVWDVKANLDLEAMNEACQYLIGEHDFKSFCTAASAEGKPTHRRVLELEVYPERILEEDVVCVRVVGNAFLHSMVRTMVGTLVEVGLGKKRPSWVKEVLEARCRNAAGQNAPACGLVFWQVMYEMGDLIPAQVWNEC